MYRKNQISRLGKTSNLEKLVLIESTDQSANCRDCEEDDLQCKDIISGRKLDFPVFKNITPSDQRCYNVNSIKQVVGKVDDSLLRTLPRDPNTTPDDPTFWQLPRDLNPAKAGRFDIDDILTVYRGDSTEEENINIAKALFAGTFMHASEFSVPDIVQLVHIGMLSEAELLFDQTIDCYPSIYEMGALGNKLAIARIVSLCLEAHLPHKGAKLYRQHTATFTPKRPPSDMPVEQIIDLHVIGLETQAVDLFNRTVEDRLNSVAVDLGFLHALHAAGLADQAKVMYLLIEHIEPQAVTTSGCFKIQSENIYATGKVGYGYGNERTERYLSVARKHTLSVCEAVEAVEMSLADDPEV